MSKGSANNQDFDLDALLGDDPKESPADKMKRYNIDISGYTAQQLDECIHQLAARRIVEMLQIPECCTPQFLQAALRFLADNKVTGKDIPEALGASVREAYKDKAPFKLAQ